MRYHIVYKTINLVNGLFYIGKHSQEGLEFDGYFGSGQVLLDAIQEFGKENFIREIVEVCESESHAFNRENYWSILLSATDHNVGYNRMVGGQGISSDFAKRMWSKPEHREKIEEAQRKFVNTPEFKQKMSKISKEYMNRPEVKQQTSKKFIDLWNNPIWREEQTKLKRERASKPEFIEKMKLVNKEMANRPEVKLKRSLKMSGINHHSAKYHYVLKDPEGNIHECEVLSEFCKEHKLSSGSLYMTFTGKRKSYKGWVLISKTLRETEILK